MMMTGKRRYVRWTSKECKLVKEAYFSLEAQARIQGVTISFSKLIKNAQNVALPKERRRSIGSKDTVFWLMEGLEEQPVETDANQLQEQSAENNQISSLEKLLTSLAGPVQSILAEVFAEAAKGLEDACIEIFESYEGRLGKLERDFSKLQAMMESPPKLPVETNPPPQIRKPKVVIYGLKGDQPEHMKKEFDEKLNLTFISVKSRGTINGRLKGDYIIAMKDFIPHVKLPDETIELSGGLDRLRQKLQSIIDDL